MVLITPSPLDEEEVKYFTKHLTHELYRAPVTDACNILSSSNHKYPLHGWDLTYQITYLMEETASDSSPVYIVFMVDESNTTDLRAAMAFICHGKHYLDIERPPSYEEAIYAKVIKLAKSFNSKALLLPKGKYVSWYCAGGENNRFRPQFFSLRRKQFTTVSNL